jgi:hypothetical protein
VDALISGSGRGKIYHFRDLKELPREELTMYGILAGSGEVYKWCMKENKNFYFMDHGYFTNAHDRPHWLRVTKNKHCQNILQQRPPDRYEKYFKQDVAPWKKGKKILVLPPTNAIANFFNVEDWLDQTNGVPVFCDPQNSAAAPISETNFSKIETPKYGDRIALFSSLAYNNWTLEEMANGTAWSMLNES